MQAYVIDRWRKVPAGWVADHDNMDVPRGAPHNQSPHDEMIDILDTMFMLPEGTVVEFQFPVKVTPDATPNATAPL